MSLSSIHARQGRRFVLVAGLALSLFAVGCDQDGATSAAIDNARMELTAMSSGEKLTPSTGRSAVYQSVLAELRPVADRGTPSQNASAALLMAQAQTGLSEPAAAAVAELEARALHQTGAIRSMLSQWMVHSTAAEAAGSYDPAPELKSIQDQVQERQAAVSQAETQKQAVDARAADLRQQASAKSEQGNSLRQEAARLRQQVANQSAVDGEQSLIQSREIARRADALEVEAAELEARAEQLDPEIQEIATRIEGVRDQIARLNAAKTEVDARAAASREEASQARAAAARIAEEIHAEVGKLRDLRSGELTEAYETAIEGYQQAATLARKAMTENRAAANLAVASAQQSVGDLHWSRAQNLELYQQTLSALAQVQPPLPHAQQYRQMASEIQAQRQAAADGATEAFNAAHSAYQAAGGSSDRIARVSNALSELVKTTSDGKLDLGATPMGEEPGYTETEAPAADVGPIEPGTTPEETMARFIAATEAGDPAAIELVHIETPEQRAAAEAMFSMMPAAKRFEQALKDQFGAEAEEAMASMGGQSGVPDLASFDPASMTFAIDGDRAEAPLPGGEMMRMRQVGGLWYLDLDEAISGPQAAMMAAMAPKISGVMDELATEVRDGKYASLQEAMAAMMTKMAQAMQGGG